MSSIGLPTIRDHALIGAAEKIPVAKATPVVSYSPVVLPMPGRAVDLHLKISLPTVNRDLPIILLSHGHGGSNNLSSLNGYGPVANFWASHGFAVIQPTHLSSKSLSLDPKTPGAPLFCVSRAADMTYIIDQLDQIEEMFPGIKGRLDRSRIAVAGHSLGGNTASMLLGMTITDPETGEIHDMVEPRIKAGVLLAAPGNGGDDLNPVAAERYPIFKHPSFAKMATPTLVVIGDEDVSPHLTTRDADWHADGYNFSTGPKSLLTIVGAKHGLGGIAGYDAKETDDESPERLAVVQRMTWAYLRSTFYPEDNAWSVACAALKDLSALARVESK